MKKLSLFFVTVVAVLTFTSCSENYSNGERIGFVTQFSNTGRFFKSHEGHLNTSQTGMNSSVPFDFSIDNDKEDPNVVALIDSAAENGWKVKLTYHQVAGFNWFGNRGNTDHFINNIEVLDRNPMSMFGNTPAAPKNVTSQSGIHDTIYVVINNSK